MAVLRLLQALFLILTIVSLLASFVSLVLLKKNSKELHTYNPKRNVVRAFEDSHKFFSISASLFVISMLLSFFVFILTPQS